MAGREEGRTRNKEEVLDEDTVKRRMRKEVESKKRIKGKTGKGERTVGVYKEE